MHHAALLLGYDVALGQGGKGIFRYLDEFDIGTEIGRTVRNGKPEEREGAVEALIPELCLRQLNPGRPAAAAAAGPGGWPGAGAAGAGSIRCMLPAPGSAPRGRPPGLAQAPKPAKPRKPPKRRMLRLYWDAN